MIVVVLVFVSLRFGFHHPGCEYEFVVSINHKQILKGESFFCIKWNQ